MKVVENGVIMGLTRGFRTILGDHRIYLGNKMKSKEEATASVIYEPKQSDMSDQSEVKFEVYDSAALLIRSP